MTDTPDTRAESATQERRPKRASPTGDRYATPEVKRRAIHLWRAGVPTPRIVKMLGWSNPAVSRWIVDARLDPQERKRVVFMRRVEFDTNAGCWLWTGEKGDHYGRVKGARGYTGAHRVSWQIHIGRIPRGLNVLHRCDVRLCVNPGHLFLGTQADNVADMYAKGRAKYPRNPRR